MCGPERWEAELDDDGPAMGMGLRLWQLSLDTRALPSCNKGL